MWIFWLNKFVDTDPLAIYGENLEIFVAWPTLFLFLFRFHSQGIVFDSYELLSMSH